MNSKVRVAEQFNPKKSQILLSIACFIVFFSTNIHSVFLSKIAHEYEFNDNQRDAYLGGWLSAAIMVGQIIGTVLAGWYVALKSNSINKSNMNDDDKTNISTTNVNDNDKSLSKSISNYNVKGRKKLLMIILTLSGTSSFLFISKKFITLFSLRFILGLAQGAIVPTVFSIVADLYIASSRPSASAIVSGAIGAGMLVGQLYAGYCDGVLKWNHLIANAGVMSILFIFPFLKYFQDPAPGYADSLAHHWQGDDSNSKSNIKSNSDSNGVINDSRLDIAVPNRISNHNDNNNDNNSEDYELQSISLLETGNRRTSGNGTNYTNNEANNVIKFSSAPASLSFMRSHQLGSYSKFKSDPFGSTSFHPSQKSTYGGIIYSLKVPTVVLLLVQALPNTIPWGVLGAFLTDFLTQESHLKMDLATSLIACFGIGSAVGGIGGGVVGGWLYRRDRRIFFLYQSLATIFGALILRWLLTEGIDTLIHGDNSNASGVSVVMKNGNSNKDHLVGLDSEQASTGMYIAAVVVVTAGVLCAINGSNIRASLLNLSYPNSRGPIIGICNLLNCVGRGIGPLMAKGYMKSTGNASRQTAIEASLALWVLAGVLIGLCTITIENDANRMSIIGNMTRSISGDSLTRVMNDKNDKNDNNDSNYKTFRGKKGDEACGCDNSTAYDQQKEQYRPMLA